MTCIDYPCCGHGYGECSYETTPMSDREYAFLSKHSMCDHEVGICDAYDD